MGEHPIQQCTCRNELGEYCNRCALPEDTVSVYSHLKKLVPDEVREEVVETRAPARDDNVLPLAAASRQVRRARSRQAKKDQDTLEKQLDETLATDDPRLKPLLKARHMLFAMIREYGRVRILATHLNSVTTADKLDVRVQENGDLVVSFVEGG